MLSALAGFNTVKPMALIEGVFGQEVHLAVAVSFALVELTFVDIFLRNNFNAHPHLPPLCLRGRVSGTASTPSTGIESSIPVPEEGHIATYTAHTIFVFLEHWLSSMDV